MKYLNLKEFIFAITLLTYSFPITSYAAQCVDTTITSPSPFMGNNDEIFKTTDGNLWQVKYSYEYMYEYSPSVMICNESKLIIKGKSIEIIQVGTAKSQTSIKQQRQIKNKVVLKPKGCRDYFLADGDNGGVYLLEWYGGFDPDVGDSIVGEIKTYGLKDVFYPDQNSSGKVYVDDFALTKSIAIEKLNEKCH